MTATSDTDDRFVMLRDGPTVPAAPYVLLLNLEARGFRVRREDTTLVVTPPSQLTSADCVAIRQHKRHLLLLVDYCARPDLDAHLFTDCAPAAGDRPRAAETRRAS